MTIQSSSRAFLQNSSATISCNPDITGDLTLAPSDNYYGQTLAFYDRLAKVYDYLYPDHLRFSDQLFELLLPILRTAGIRRVVDGSCGVGHDMSCLLRRGFEVDGVDISNSMLDMAAARLRAAGYNHCNLYHGDVQSLATLVGKAQYDLALFRGNTLSNIHPNDLEASIQQLVAVVRPGGLLLLDYRDGQQQISERRRYELRGWGIAGNPKRAFLSYYFLRHSVDIHEPYEVRATVHVSNLRSVCSTERIAIRSHYVVGEDVMRALRRVPVQRVEFPFSNHKGLPYLETLLLRRA
jgi:SAM-dependent methyltransferase